MLNIDTETIRQIADILDKEAVHYQDRLSRLDGCISWIKQQEFDKDKKMYKVLMYQYEELQREKKKFALMAEVLRRVCDKYDRTEERIVESGETFRKLIGSVNSVDLKLIRSQLSELGIYMINR